MNRCRLGLGLFLTLLLPLNVQAQDGWAKFGRALAEMSPGAREERERQYQDEALRRHLDELQLMQYKQAADIRAALLARWQLAGFSYEQASALSDAFDPDNNRDFGAIRLSLKGLPPDAMAGLVGKALDQRQFHLANQLLMAMVIEMKPAPSIEDNSNSHYETAE